MDEERFRYYVPYLTTGPNGLFCGCAELNSTGSIDTFAKVQQLAADLKARVKADQGLDVEVTILDWKRIN